MNSLFSRQKSLSHFLFSTSSPPPRILCFSLFSTSSSSNHPTSSFSHSHPSPSRRYDEESRNVRVSVWWDVENCSVPTGINVFKIAQSITTAVRVNGIKGPVQISAFGDVFQLPRAIQEALSVTGINLVHVPNGGKNSADRSILVDLMQWVSQNPPPAHIFLISGDRDFAGVLHRLRMNNYNILLAGVPCDSSAVLCSASSIMWNWSELARGENFSGRHFNQPPDGPFNSWYGHYRGPLEDPFEIPVQQNSSKVNDSPDEGILSDKVLPVPKTLLNKIRRIVDSYPYGVSVTELRAELTRSQVNIDRDYYGYKKFSRLLLSIPHIIKAVPVANGALIIRPVSSKVQKPVQIDGEGLATKNEIQDAQMNAKASDKTHSPPRMMEIEPMVLVSSYNDTKEKATKDKLEETHERKVSNTYLREHQAASTKKLHGNDVLDVQGVKGPKLEETPEKKMDSLSEDRVAFSKELRHEKTSDGRVVKHPVALSEEKNPKNEMGFFRRIWTKWYSSVESEETKHHIPDRFHASTSSPEWSTSEERPTKSTNQRDINVSSFSSSSAALSMNAKSSIVDNSDPGQGFIAKVMSWFRPRGSELPVNTLIEQSRQESGLIKDSTKHVDCQYTRNHELFSDESFWTDIESYLRTDNRLHKVLNSTSREQFATRLQKDGPLVLQSLQEVDLLHLVDLLVSEKKWIREFPSETPHFRIILPLPDRRHASTLPDNSNGLSSIFLSSSHEKNISDVHKKPSEKTRIEILTDCKQLLDELLQQHPEGFDRNCFRMKFFEKYGYPLNSRKLGYPGLASLIQIMPGVKIESHKIFPDTVVYAPGIGSLKHDDIESPWEELGPVSENSNLSKPEKRSHQNNVYEPCASEDDEFSDMEEEGSTTCTKAQERNKSKVIKDESSLLQILDDWYSSKDESDHNTSVFESSEISPKKEATPSGSSSIIGEKDGVSTTVDHAWKQRPRKSYTFVSDSEEKQRQADQCHVG